MKKGLILAILLGGTAAGFLLYYIVKGKISNDVAAKQKPNLLDPNADVNIYRQNPAINSQNTPPTAQPVSAYLPNYRALIDNETIAIAQNSQRAKAVQQNANIPTEAYRVFLGDTVLTQQTKRMFVQRFNINPDVAADYPFPSTYESQSFKADLEKIVASIAALKLTITQQGNLTKTGRAASFLKYIKLNPQAFVVRYWLLDFQNLVKEVITQTENYQQDTAKVNLLSAFFDNLATVQIPRLDAAIRTQAINDLKARGYRFLEYP